VAIRGRQGAGLRRAGRGRSLALGRAVLEALAYAEAFGGKNAKVVRRGAGVTVSRTPALETDESPASAGFLVMERTGIEPVTSGLQILSRKGQGWSARAGAGWLRQSTASDRSQKGHAGQPDLTRI
jgi:hypothetical protein